MELCLLHHHLNSVALFIQKTPERIPFMVNLLEILKKKHGIKTLAYWVTLDWETRFEHLSQLSFSNLQVASRLSDDIYGNACFDRAWGTEAHKRLTYQYQNYQTLRNAIIHRGGELSSGINIEASERDIETTFEDLKVFREAILALSNGVALGGLTGIRIQPYIRGSPNYSLDQSSGSTTFNLFGTVFDVRVLAGDVQEKRGPGKVSLHRVGEVPMPGECQIFQVRSTSVPMSVSLEFHSSGDGNYFSLNSTLAGCGKTGVWD